MTHTMKEGRGVVEWAVMLLPTAIMLVGAILAYNNLQNKVEYKCAEFTSEIQRINESGSKASATNGKDIVELKTNYATIKDQLVTLKQDLATIKQGQDSIISSQMEMVKYIGDIARKQ